MLPTFGTYISFGAPSLHEKAAISENSEVSSSLNRHGLLLPLSKIQLLHWMVNHQGKYQTGNVCHQIRHFYVCISWKWKWNEQTRLSIKPITRLRSGAFAKSGSETRLPSGLLGGQMLQIWPNLKVVCYKYFYRIIFLCKNLQPHCSYCAKDDFAHQEASRPHCKTKNCPLFFSGPLLAVGIFLEILTFYVSS